MHRIDAHEQWHLHMLLGIKWCQHLQNVEERRTAKQPRHLAIVQSCSISPCLGTLHECQIEADAKKI